MPKSKIESEVRPYLNLLIENGASQVWLQKFYKRNIKYKTIEAINSLSNESFFEQIQLLRMFIANQAIHDKKAYQKLITIRKLFRHSDLLADKLQNELTKQILINPHQPVYSFLAQDAEKILNTLYGLQVLLEIRERLQKVKDKEISQYKKIIDEQEIWLKKEIHSRVPLAHRKNEIPHSLKPIITKKWNIQKERGGYDTGPDRMWYFFNGELKLTLFFQREFLKLLALWLEFNQLANNIVNRKKSFMERLFYFIKSNIFFGAQLVSLLFFPYRFLRTVMAEFNQFVFYSLRGLFEFFFPLKHCNKSLFHFTSLGIQAVIYLWLMLKIGFSYGAVFPFFMINSMQLLTIATAFFVVYNTAAFITSIANSLFSTKFKEAPKSLDVSPELADKAHLHSTHSRQFTHNRVYIPSCLKERKSRPSKTLFEQPVTNYFEKKSKLKT